jgi:hypothetical protein
MNTFEEPDSLFLLATWIFFRIRNRRDDSGCEALSVELGAVNAAEGVRKCQRRFWQAQRHRLSLSGIHGPFVRLPASY